MLAGPLRGWVAGRQAGWLGRPNASKACTLRQKISFEAPKMQTLQQEPQDSIEGEENSQNDRQPELY